MRAIAYHSHLARQNSISLTIFFHFIRYSFASPGDYVGRSEYNFCLAGVWSSGLAGAMGGARPARLLQYGRAALGPDLPLQSIGPTQSTRLCDDVAAPASPCDQAEARVKYFTIHTKLAMQPFTAGGRCRCCEAEEQSCLRAPRTCDRGRTDVGLERIGETFGARTVSVRPRSTPIHEAMVAMSMPVARLS